MILSFKRFLWDGLKMGRRSNPVDVPSIKIVTHPLAK